MSNDDISRKLFDRQKVLAEKAKTDRKILLSKGTKQQEDHKKLLVNKAYKNIITELDNPNKKINLVKCNRLIDILRHFQMKEEAEHIEKVLKDKKKNLELYQKMLSNYNEKDCIKLCKKLEKDNMLFYSNHLNAVIIRMRKRIERRKGR